MVTYTINAGELVCEDCKILRLSVKSALIYISVELSTLGLIREIINKLRNSDQSNQELPFEAHRFRSILKSQSNQQLKDCTNRLNTN